MIKYKEAADIICDKTYSDLISNYKEISNIETACFNMTYTYLILKKIYPDNQINIIFTENVESERNLISILNR